MAQPIYSNSYGYIGERFFTMQFDVALDAANPPPINAFDVRINGSGVSITGVTVDSTGKTVTLTFSAATLTPGDIIEFSYSDPTGGNDVNAIQGLDGTDSATFMSATIVFGGRPGPSAPPVPVLSSGSDSGTLADGITSDATPTLTGTSGANATVKLYDTDGTTLLGTTSADGSGNWSITSSQLSEGSHSLKVTQTDAGNITSPFSTGLSVTIDTVAAAPTSLAMSNASDSGTLGDGITNASMPIITGVAEANASVRLYDTDGSTVLGTTTADGSGNWSITSSTLTTGSHTLTAKQTDAAGNVSAASSGLTVLIDNSAAAPAAPVLASGSDGGALGDGLTNIATPTINGTAEANANVTLYDTDGITVLGTAVANGSGAWSIVSSTLSNSAHTLTVRQTDTAGNVSSASTGLALTVNNVPPLAPSPPALSPASDSGTQGDGITSVAAPVITGTAAANATVKLYDTDGSTVLGTAVANGAGDWSITSSTLSLGSHALTAKQIDQAGNVSAASASLALTVEAVPTPPSSPATTPLIDGVAVTQQPVIIPGGGSGTQIIVPIVGIDRSDTSGSTSVADIPLATSDAGNLLLAQIPRGVGLISVGGTSLLARSSTEHLIQAIRAATPEHATSDQGHLTGNGVAFLNQLAASVPLLVQTITPSTGTTAPTGPLTLTGTSNDTQHTALVIDASSMPSGSNLVLNSVDFAAIIGSVNVTGNTNGQILTGDAANQQFSVLSGSNSSVFAGGGSDTLNINFVGGGAMLLSNSAANDGTVLLHGGQGNDTVVFNGASSNYRVENHEGYVLITSKVQPGQHTLLVNAESLTFTDTTISVKTSEAQTQLSGLYQSVLGRQADYLGFDYWAVQAKNGVSMGNIALSLITSAEAQNGHAVALNGNPSHDLELLYQGLFGRKSDSTGLAYWVDAMQQGMTLEQVASSFVQAAEMDQHQVAAANWDFIV